MLENTSIQNVKDFTIQHNINSLDKYFSIEKASYDESIIDNNIANEILDKVNLVLQNSSYISLQNYHILSQCFFDLSTLTNNSHVIDKQNYLKALMYQQQLIDKMILFVNKLIIEYN
jgi:hypothetical protein